MIYALYRDDELLDFSYSLEDLAKRTGRKLSSLRWLATPAAHKRKLHIKVYRWEDLYNE